MANVFHLPGAKIGDPRCNCVSCERSREPFNKLEAFMSLQSQEEKSCQSCGQSDTGQTGEYACSECGLPTLHDAAQEANKNIKTVNGVKWEYQPDQACWTNDKGQWCCNPDGCTCKQCALSVLFSKDEEVCFRDHTQNRRYGRVLFADAEHVKILSLGQTYIRPVNQVWKVGDST